MNLKSLIVSFGLVAATSTAVLAKPATYTVGAEASVTFGTASPSHSAVVVRDHRGPRSVPAHSSKWMKPQFRPRPLPQLVIDNNKLINSHKQVSAEYIGPVYKTGRSSAFVAMTAPTKIENNRHDFILLGSNGPTTAIQLRAVAGSSFVKQVTIEFMNGEAQVVQLNRSLDMRNGVITIDLDGGARSIKRLFVYGSTASGSAYQIYAR